MIQVKEIMDKSFSKIAFSDSVEAASKLMDEKKTDYLLVEGEGGIKGVVTSRGIVGYPSSRIILDCGIKEAVFISEEILLDEALGILDEKKVDFLVILNNENVAGIIDRKLIISFLYQGFKKSCKEKEKVIAELTKANAAIKQAVKEWDRTFNAIADWIFIIDEDFTITKANKAFAEAFKLSPQEVVGKKCYELVHKSDRPWKECPVELTRKDKKINTQEINDPNLGVPLLITSAPIFNDKGEFIGVVHIAKNIAERKEMQAQLFQAEKFASLGQLSAGLTHSLNSPLMGLLNFIESFRDETRREDRKYRELTQMLEAVNHMIRIVKDLGVFARISKSEFSELCLNELIDSTLGFSVNQFMRKDIKITKNYADDLLRVKGDRNQLQQVILNIIGNACDAMSAEGEFTIVTRNSQDGGKVIMEFSDTGGGINEKILPYIFNPFFTTKKQGEGVGLGLSVSHGIISDHKGEIKAENLAGKGAKITVVLPLN
ncbi:MAG: ATP-binding protein [bacterium]